ncbi:MAG: glycine rich domain-containing protein [bacterium]|nr:glycine rich domain-containing protein [bacterium]
MKIKISNLLNNKRAKYFIVVGVLVLFCLVLNIAFSAFTHTASGVAANLSLRDMTYNVTIDSEAGAIVKVSANTVLKLNTKFVATNNIKSNYELSYDVCSDATCSSTLTKPSTLTVQYSSRTTDPFKGQIDATGTKNIRVVITNDGSELYIRLRMNSGYYYNTLQLEKKITTVYNEDDLTVYAYIDGVEVDSFPTSSNYGATVSCHKDGSTTVANATGTATYTDNKWVVSISGVDEGRTVCDVNFTTSMNFAYNGTTGADGTVQILNIASTGKYKIEAWGASGGGSGVTAKVGYGGYSTGVVSLNANQKLYIYVGGAGQTVTTATTQISGGFNGGGSAYSTDSYGTNNYGSGGGATHVSTQTGILSTLQNARSSILIVAGGGGGSAYYKNGTTYYHYGSGGSGGGISGVSSYNGYSSNQTVRVASGGGQSAVTTTTTNIVNGTFGTGANGKEAYSGGGGGYFGGQSSFLCGAGGGSGYIGNSLLSNKVMYCYNCTASSAESTKTVSTTCYNSEATTNCAKVGNGYVRITMVS